MGAAMKLHRAVPMLSEVPSTKAAVLVHGLQVIVYRAKREELEVIRETLTRVPRSHVALVADVTVYESVAAPRRSNQLAVRRDALAGRRLCGALLQDVAHLATRVFHLTLGVRPEELGRTRGTGVWDRFVVAYARYHQNRERLRLEDPQAFATVERQLQRQLRSSDPSSLE